MGLKRHRCSNWCEFKWS